MVLDENARKGRDTLFGVCNSIHNMTPGDPDDTLKYLWCVEKEWKLLILFDAKDTTKYRNVHIWDKAPVRLFNIKGDPNEKNDVSSEYPEVVDRMRKKIADWHAVDEG